MTDAETMHELCRLRSTLEAFAVINWRKRADRSVIAKRLRSIMKRLRDAAMGGDYPLFHSIDSELHRAVVELAGLPVLIKCWEAVSSDMAVWLRNVQQVYWPNLMDLYREHEFLLEAWEFMDDWVAENATHQHIEAGWYRMAAARKEVRSDIGPVDRATAFMSTHFASRMDMDVEWIARHISYVSAVHLTRLFRRKMGLSPHEYLQRVRLDRAAQLLRSGSNAVAEIGHLVGYENVSHFVRAFRNRFAVTPLAYRRKAR